MGLLLGGRNAAGSLQRDEGVAPGTEEGEAPAAFRLYDLRHTFATTLLAEGAPLTYVAAQMGHTKPTTTLLWYAHWLPRGDKHWVDALDGAGSQARGIQLVANSTEVDASVVEVIERLEPTIGLEPMTCRLRIDCSTN